MQACVWHKSIKYWNLPGLTYDFLQKNLQDKYIITTWIKKKKAQCMYVCFSKQEAFECSKWSQIKRSVILNECAQRSSMFGLEGAELEVQLEFNWICKKKNTWLKVWKYCIEFIFSCLSFLFLVILLFVYFDLSSLRECWDSSFLFFPLSSFTDKTPMEQIYSSPTKLNVLV